MPVQCEKDVTTNDIFYDNSAKNMLKSENSYANFAWHSCFIIYLKIRRLHLRRNKRR
jgi:hypothetical protein